MKMLLILTLASQLAHSQQLSPVQLQKVKTNFDTALNAKKFDDAQTYLKQIEQGGRKAYAQELAVELAKARQKDIEAKGLAELHKAQKAHAQEIIDLRRLEERNAAQIEEFERNRDDKKEQAALRRQLDESKKAAEKLAKELQAAKASASAAKPSDETYKKLQEELQESLRVILKQNKDIEALQKQIPAKK